jgi:hypothetical protein
VLSSRPNEDGDANGNSNVPGYDFFRADGKSYVPSGISREEYAKLRKGEIEKEMKMNYGAWGPRFKRTSVPDGDWMMMPNLWTAGRVNRPEGRCRSSSEIDDIDGPRLKIALQKLYRFLQNNATAFILAYTLIHCIEIGFLIWGWKAEHMSPRKVLRIILRSVLFQRKVMETTVVKLAAARLAIAMALTPILNGRLEYLNRRYLWSKKRSLTTVIAASTLLMALWCGVLQFISFS